MHGRFDHRAVDAQLAPTRHLQLLSQLGHAIQQAVQRLGLDQVGPAQQRRVVRHRLQSQSAELAQHQAVIDKVLGLLVAPGVQMLDDQQPQDHLDRRRGSSRLRGVRSALGQVRLHLLKELIVLKQPVQLGQLGLVVQHQRRHQPEQVDRRVPIS